jgi:hypothetical protein
VAEKKKRRGGKFLGANNKKKGGKFSERFEKCTTSMDRTSSKRRHASPEPCRSAAETGQEGTRPVTGDKWRSIVDPDGLFAAHFAPPISEVAGAATAAAKKKAKPTATKEGTKLPMVMSHVLEEPTDPEGIAVMDRAVAAIMARITASKKY